MSQKFHLLPVAHGVNRSRVELASIGKSATTYDQVMLPETWKDAVNIQVGDEMAASRPTSPSVASTPTSSKTARCRMRIRYARAGTARACSSAKAAMPCPIVGTA
jgi:hypothetical protein